MKWKALMIISILAIVAGFLAVVANNKIDELVNRDEIGGVYMVLVPAGCFNMGSEMGSEMERPVHNVCIEEDFWIDQYEVTNEQFETLNGVAEDLPDWSHPKKPRTSVTWFEAQAFCELRGGNLPTEAQWEYTARGPDSLIYPWGDEFIGRNVTYRENSRWNNRTFGGEPSVVGSRPGGVSWIGAHDMSGNVNEWIGKIDTDYSFDQHDFDMIPADWNRVSRGGSFFAPASLVRSSTRFYHPDTFGSDKIGFRCVVSVPVP